MNKILPKSAEMVADIIGTRQTVTQTERTSGGLATEEASNTLARGMTKATSYSVLRQAKHIMIQRGFDFYDNKRLGTVPTEVVGEILGLELTVHGE